MKNALNQLASFRGFLIALIVFSVMGFAAARYDIYRLRPVPAPGQTIGYNNGLWGPVSLLAEVGKTSPIADIDTTNASGEIIFYNSMEDNTYVPALAIKNTTGIHYVFKSIAADSCIGVFYRADTLVKSTPISYNLIYLY